MAPTHTVSEDKPGDMCRAGQTHVRDTLAYRRTCLPDCENHHKQVVEEHAFPRDRKA